MAMARGNGRNHARESIAHAAARLMAEEGVEDYAQAKRKAARQVGALDARQMPNNDEIDAALKLYRDIYQPEHAAQLRVLRKLALDIMDELAAFQPCLVGSVLTGSAGKYADIHLHLFSDSDKSIEHYLLNHDIRFRGGAARLYAGNMLISAPVLSFRRDDCDVHLTLLSTRESRAQLKTSVAGKPMDRARREEVAALIARS